MAKYGIDRALLAADRPETDRPADRMLDIDNPWARVKAHLLCGLASALRCQCVILPRPRPGQRIHMFGYASDIERTDVLYTSVLIQMWHGPGRRPGARLEPQPAGLAAQLAARLRDRRGRPGPRRRARPASARRPRRGRRRRRAPRWCWPTGPW